MHSCVFNEFGLVFCLFCTVYLEGLVVYCENWVLFVISHQKTFWVFWFTQTSFYVHQKTQKVFWFEMPNSHCCAMKLNSHSALLNLLDSQCKTAENQSKLIAQRAVHFSRSWQHVPFWFFHGKDTFPCEQVATPGRIGKIVCGHQTSAVEEMTTIQQKMIMIARSSVAI